MSDSAPGCSSFGEPTSPPSSLSDSTAVGLPKTISSTSDSSDCNVCASDSESQTSTLTSTHSDHIRQGDHHQQLQSSRHKPRHSRTLVRRMRNERKKRKRLQKKKSKCCSKSMIANLKQELRKEQEVVKRKDMEVIRYKSMARSYWDRWQWELQKRKEAHRDQVKLARGVQLPSQSGFASSQHEINPEHLSNPTQDGKPCEIYLGRGSFSVVRLQLYRNILVAVKELLPRNTLADVIREAKILNKLCHPFLPFLFGVCTTVRPLRIVTQFHGISSKTVTLRQALLLSQNIARAATWIVVCSEVLEAVRYLHSESSVIHNDIKADNILLSKSDSNSSSKEPTSSGTSPLTIDCHVVLIDFGKATGKDSGRQYRLSRQEKMNYLTKYPQIAPEVVHGEYRQTVYSDMFSLGQVLVQISDRGHFSSLPVKHKNKLFSLIEKCRSIRLKGWDKR